MAKAPPAPVVVVAPPKKGPNPAVTGLKKGLEKANALQKKTAAKVRELREGGRYGRAVVDTLEVGAGGFIAGALDGAGLNIPVGDPKYYAWVEVSTKPGEDGKPILEGFVNSSEGDNKSVTLGEASRGLQTEQMSIPLGAPVGLTLVAAGAYMEQPDLLELGKGMVGYGFGRLGADGARAVRRAMFGEDAA